LIFKDVQRVRSSVEGGVGKGEKKVGEERKEEILWREIFLK